MILLIDHFDSFTYNIVQAYQKLGFSVVVYRGDKITAECIRKQNPRLLVLGPGPGSPAHYLATKALISLAQEGIPIFGLCLGHQIIGEYFGAAVVRAEEAIHGKPSFIYHNDKGPFKGISQQFKAIRYHSLVIDPATLTPELEITAWTEKKEIMGIGHRTLPIQGVQFHPESIASDEGLALLENTLKNDYIRKSEPK